MIILRKLFGKRQDERNNLGSLMVPFVEGLIKTIMLSQYDSGCAKHWEKNPVSMLKKTSGSWYTGLELFMSLVDDYKDLKIDETLKSTITKIRGDQGVREFIFGILDKMKKERSYSGNKYASLIDRMLKDKGEDGFITEFRAKVKLLTLLLTGQIKEEEDIEWWDQKVARTKVEWKHLDPDFTRLSEFIKMV